MLKRSLNRLYSYRIFLIVVVLICAAAGVQILEQPTSGQGGVLIVGHTRGLATERIVTFNSTSPGTLITNVPAAGLNPNERLIGIDFRPQNGLLYGVASTGTSSRLVLINHQTGSITTVGSGITPPLPLSQFYGVDFNPTTDRLRIVGTDQRNIRVNPDLGAIEGTDTNLTPASGGFLFVDQIAHSNNIVGATQSTLFAGDANSGSFARIGGVNGTPSPNGGVVNLIGSFGLPPLNQSSGMDIGPNGEILIGYNNTLFSVNQTSGQTTSLGAISSAVSLGGFSIAINAPTPPLNLTAPAIAVGPGPGGGNTIRILDASGNSQGTISAPFGTSFTGGIRVATGDVNGDGRPDLVVGTASGGSQVRVFDGNGGGLLSDFIAYSGFNGGVTVAVGDVNGDGVDDIVTGSGPGATPHVKAFSGANNSPILSFFPYTGLTTGVNVAAGDVTGDGRDDIVTGTTSGAGPHVKVFNGTTGSEVRSFFAYETSFMGGVFVGAGDVDGDGRADVITGSGPGTAAHVKVFDGRTGAEVRSILPFPSGPTGGVSVAAGDINLDGSADVSVTVSPGVGVALVVYEGDSTSELLRNSFGFAPEGDGGSASVFVAVASRPPVTISGQVTTPAGLGLRNALVSLINPQGFRRTATTSSFGIYSFDGVPHGGPYTVTATTKRYRFAPRTVTANANLTNINFVGLE